MTKAPLHICKHCGKTFKTGQLFEQHIARNECVIDFKKLSLEELLKLARL